MPQSDDFVQEFAMLSEITRDLTLTNNDREFLRRVFTTDLEIYKRQLVRLGFVGRTKVLDAGCGFGQWTLALASMNNEVVGLDSSGSRLQVLNKLAAARSQINIQTQIGSLEALPFDDQAFDSIFCFGAIFLTNWHIALDEFARVLQPGGKLFLTANDIGWYVHCWVNQPNRTSDYDPRKVAAMALANTLKSGKQSPLEGDRIISMAEMREALVERSIPVHEIQPEIWRGKGTFFGLPGVYEVLGESHGAQH